MTVKYKGNKFHAGRWHKLQYDTVKSKRHQLYDVLQTRMAHGDDYCTVEYFNINGVKVPLDCIYSRYGMMGFDFSGAHYPMEINCYTDRVGSYLEGTLLQINEYGDKCRIWKETK